MQGSSLIDNPETTVAAPIALFVYNRAWHTRHTVEALQKNDFAKESDLYIFSDAAKSAEAALAVEEVRAYVRHVGGFKSISIVERQKNLGLANSIIDGVTKVTSEHGRVIVLEDDMVTSQHFLTYMNDALNRYAEDERVISIHGYIYPVKVPLPEAFFLPGADCWGWATWRRGWALFNSNGQYLLDELRRRKMLRAFDFNDSYAYSTMLENQIKGTNDSWAVRWYASAFLAGKLTLYPGRSLVNNIGNDDSGTHCEATSNFDAELSKTPIDLNTIKVGPSQYGRQAFAAFFRSSKAGLLQRFLNRANALLKPNGR
jgi:hypothetical protein